MTMRRVLIVLLLVVAGGLGFFALRPPPPPQQAAVAPPAPPPAMGRIIVTARSLTPGTLLTEVDLVAAEVRLPLPPEAIEAGAIADFRGALVRRFMPRGHAVTRDDVMHPGERGFLAAVLRPGHRAISIGVDATTGAGGLVAPGDIVDLVLVQNFAEASAARRVTAETVLTLMRVIAVDQVVAQGPGGGGRVARTVTLEVTPEGAERVAVAEQLGRLAVTVRPAIETTEETRAGAAVYGGDVSNALVDFSIPPPRMRVIQGGDAQEFTFR